MDNQTLITLLVAVGTLVVGLIAIIYSNLNAKSTCNSEEIKEIKEKFVTKEDYNRENDKLDKKLDKIIDILITGGN